MKRLITLFHALIATFAIVQAQQAADIIGTWESDKKDVRMEFFKAGDTYQARLLWGNKVVEQDGTTSKKDVKNPDAQLRTRNIIGQVTLTGLKWDGKEYVDGKIYDPPSGDTYTCKAWMENGKLNLRGYLGVSLFGQTVTWHRYTKP